eukprot:5358957-Prymnesium_polylepis.2
MGGSRGTHHARIADSLSHTRQAGNVSTERCGSVSLGEAGSRPWPRARPRLPRAAPTCDLERLCLQRLGRCFCVQCGRHATTCVQEHGAPSCKCNLASCLVTPWLCSLVLLRS